jgi:hypothetical protein
MIALMLHGKSHVAPYLKHPADATRHRDEGVRTQREVVQPHEEGSLLVTFADEGEYRDGSRT